MPREAVQCPDVPPAAGPYSSAVVYNGVAFLSGQGPHDSSGRLAGADIASQTRQVLQNLAAVAQSAGTDLRLALQVRVFLASMEHFAGMNAVYAEFFDEPYPARTTVQTGLPLPGMLVEIDAAVALTD